MGTTFKQSAPGVHAGYEYGRSGNPTRNSLEECLAPLEKAKYALTFASGLGALTTLSYLLKTGDHIVTVVFNIEFLFKVYFEILKTNKRMTFTVVLIDFSDNAQVEWELKHHSLIC